MSIRTYINFILIISIINLFFYVNDIKAECLNIDVNVLNYNKSFCISLEDASEQLQQAIDFAYKNGGGIIYLSPGNYKIKTPLNLKSNVSIYGHQGLTKILIYSKEAFIVNKEDSVSFIHIKDLIFEDKNTGSSYVFLIEGGLQNSIFENLRFFGSEKQTLFYLCPNSRQKPPAGNIIFNEFKNIYADNCGRCIVYEGKPYSIISENIWSNIRLMNVYNKAIDVINWVDTEKWYNLYAMAVRDNVILVDINAYNLEHAHGFHFYSPTLVYGWNLLKSEKKPIAIRLGRNTIRNIFIGVSTDKKWDNFLVDDNAFSYYIVMDTMEDRTKVNPPQKSYVKVITKGIIKVEIEELK